MNRFFLAITSIAAALGASLSGREAVEIKRDRTPCPTDTGSLKPRSRRLKLVTGTARMSQKKRRKMDRRIYPHGF